MISKLKKAPAVERVNGFFVKVKNGWTTRKSAALFSMAILCGGAWSMVGCGADNPLSSGSEISQSQDLTTKRVVHLNASGELIVSRVGADHGDMLTISSPNGNVELPRSEVLGVQTGPPTDEGVTFAKGNYLDSYGDKYSDIEYLLGRIGKGYRSLTDGEIKVVRVSVGNGITFSGKEVALYHDDIKLLIYADEYWLTD